MCRCGIRIDVGARTRAQRRSISLPFLNDVPAAGKTPVTLARDLEQRLKNLIVTPQVTVAVDEPMPLKISVLGEVLEPDCTTSSQVRVSRRPCRGWWAEGVCAQDRIFVLRDVGNQPQRIRMTYQALTGAQDVQRLSASKPATSWSSNGYRAANQLKQSYRGLQPSGFYSIKAKTSGRPEFAGIVCPLTCVTHRDRWSAMRR